MKTTLNLEQLDLKDLTQPQFSQPQLCLLTFRSNYLNVSSISVEGLPLYINLTGSNTNASLTLKGGGRGGGLTNNLSQRPGLRELMIAEVMLTCLKLHHSFSDLSRPHPSACVNFCLTPDAIVYEWANEIVAKGYTHSFRAIFGSEGNFFNSFWLIV